MCEHEKMYEHDNTLLSLPAKIPWKCKKCGGKGYEVLEDNYIMKKLQEDFERVL